MSEFPRPESRVSTPWALIFGCAWVTLSGPLGAANGPGLARELLVVFLLSEANGSDSSTVSTLVMGAKQRGPTVWWGPSAAGRRGCRSRLGRPGMGDAVPMSPHRFARAEGCLAICLDVFRAEVTDEVLCCHCACDGGEQSVFGDAAHL